MKMRLIGNIAMSIIVTGLVACVDIPQEQHTSFETITLTPQDITYPVRWSVSIVGKGDVSVIPQTSGQLMEVCVMEGESVRKGQKLFVIDQRQAKLTLMTARADVEVAEASLSTARLEYESNQNLFDKGIVSDYLLNTSRNDYNTAKAALSQAKAYEAQAELNLEFCTITSPVDGVVGSIPNNPGDMVSQTTRLTTISGNSEMIAKFSLTEDQLYEITESGDNLNDVLSTLPDLTLVTKDGKEYPYKGRMESVSGVVDNFTGSVLCRAVFPNPTGMLYSGMQGSVILPFEYSDMIVVPQSAIVRLQDKSMVYRVNGDNCAESVMVTVEDLNGKDVVITDGIEPGAVIVAKGAANVHEGQQVIFPDEKKKTE